MGWNHLSMPKLQRFKLKVNLNHAQINRDLNSATMHFWSKFGNPNFNRWWVMTWITSKSWEEFLLLISIWPWRSRSIAPKTIRILAWVFYTSYPNLVILAWMGDELGDTRTDGYTDRQTDTGNDNTRRPKLASGKNGTDTNHGTIYLTLIPAWIGNYIHFKVWDEITYQFLNFKSENG